MDGNDAFLLADIALDAREYNLNWKNLTWKKSGIRSWLNGYDASVNEPRPITVIKTFSVWPFLQKRKM